MSAGSIRKEKSENTRRMIMEKTPLIKTLVFIPFIFLYLVCIDKGIVTIDPCSATPGHNYTTGLILLATFPFVAGALLYWCLSNFDFPKHRRYRISGLLPPILLAVSSFLMITLFFHIEEELRNSESWFFLYDLDCYNDAFPKPPVLFMAISGMFYLLLLMAFTIFRTGIKRRNRYK